MISDREFHAIVPGDIVRIVYDWNGLSGANSAGKMDQYLGTEMTVHERTGRGNLRMVEDAGRWVWNRWCIEEILPEKTDEIYDLQSVSVLIE